ncbi:hypothetical protein DNTS_026104 [Danionella cerebrum]|uniref:Sema domain-containing protein n=1 Tax=Danionella cerebrum TaxID=2873325 RepID=A0A553RGA6_9TELE|nr:hypothetical protein DNTS_026104 [Danionella translucida]
MKVLHRLCLNSHTLNKSEGQEHYEGNSQRSSLTHRCRDGLRKSVIKLWELNRTWVFQAGEGRLQHSSMLLDETHGQLLIGGRDILYSLNLDRISAPHREISWASSEEQVEDCLLQGREKPECSNYVKLLQQLNSSHLLACGTGAFSPVCTYVRVGQGAEIRRRGEGDREAGFLSRTLEIRGVLDSDHIESGRGRSPFHPNSPSTSTVHRGELFVGLYTDYWENDAAFYRFGNQSFIRTEVGDRQQLNGE